MKYCKQFFSFYSRHTGQQPVDQSDLPLIGQQAVDQLNAELLTRIPWGHHIYIFTKSENVVQLEDRAHSGDFILDL